MQNLVLPLIVCCLMCACGAPQQDQQRPQSAKEKITPSEIPADVSFSVISTDIIPGMKRSLEIRLNKRVSQEALRAIALKLKTEDPARYDRTFILYYLPDMEPGAGAWASTHFNPALEVRILGLPAEREAALKSESNEPAREVIGSWLYEYPGFGTRIVIYTRDGKIFAEETYKDGSRGTDELIEKPGSSGRRFYKKNPLNPRVAQESGDHWLLDQSGNLQIRDNEGLIGTAKKFQ